VTRDGWDRIGARRPGGGGLPAPPALSVARWVHSSAIGHVSPGPSVSVGSRTGAVALETGE
jgi:hypothetical protein